MYLILGDPVPALANPLFGLLTKRGEEVLHIPGLTSGVGFTWTFGTEHSQSELRLSDGRVIREEQISAAIIQRLARPQGDTGAEQGYDICAEQEASWFGWFWSLKCRVINRYPPIFWFSKSVPASLWQPWLTQCSLSATDATLSNSAERLEAFTSSFPEEVVYSPLSISKMYRLNTREDWNGLGKLITLLPVNLTRFKWPLYFAGIVGKSVFWNDAVPPVLTSIQPALIELAATGGLSFVEIGLLIIDGQPCIHSVNPFPQLTGFKPEGCQAIASALVDEMQSAPAKPLKRPSGL